MPEIDRENEIWAKLNTAVDDRDLYWVVFYTKRLMEIHKTLNEDNEMTIE